MRTILRALSAGLAATVLSIGLSSCSALFGTLGYGGYGYDGYGYDGYGYDNYGYGYDPYGYGNYDGYGYGYPDYYPDRRVIINRRPRVIRRTRTVHRPVVVDSHTNVIYTYDNRTGRVVATRVYDDTDSRPVYNSNGRSSSRTTARTRMPDVSNPNATVRRSYPSSTAAPYGRTVTRSAGTVRQSTPTTSNSDVNSRWSTPTQTRTETRTMTPSTPTESRTTTTTTQSTTTTPSRSTGGNSPSRR